jgi:hypothetical protein
MYSRFAILLYAVFAALASAGCSKESAPANKMLKAGQVIRFSEDHFGCLTAEQFHEAGRYNHVEPEKYKAFFDRHYCFIIPQNVDMTVVSVIDNHEGIATITVGDFSHVSPVLYTAWHSRIYKDLPAKN